MIKVVGLGPGAAGHLSLETMELLQSGAKVILRTAVHPTVERLQAEGVAYTSCDDLYEAAASFEEVYGSVVKRVLQAAMENPEGDVVYAVPGSPLVAEKTVVIMREQAKEYGIPVKIYPAMSFLDLGYVELGIDPIAGLRIIDAQDEDAVPDAGRYPLMITQVYSRLVASNLKIMLMECLEDEQEIFFLRNLGLPDQECRSIKLYELDHQPNIDHLTSVYIPAVSHSMAGIMSFGEDEEDAEPIYGEEDEVECRYIVSDEELADEDDEDDGMEYTDSLNDVDVQPLVDVIAALRAPGGCPWDREQTYQSIRSNFIEEVYEYLEAVDAGDYAGMQEELGDVLMQVVFHAQMAQEEGKFDLQDVVDQVVDKLIRRHPHVFGDTKVENSAEVLVNWDAIKKQEKQERKHVLDGVSQGLPALLRGYKLQSKAAKVGFDWDDKAAVWAKVQEELGELQEALAAGDKAAAESELGDVLFALVNYGRHQGLEPEVAMNGTNNRFASRFAHVEEQVVASGREWSSFTLEELDQFWNQAKAEEAKSK